MAAIDKPRMTGGSHPLPFEKLAPLEFERLCLWLVRREGYERAEHLGEAGSEQGRDVLAWKDGQRVVFQCKRVLAFTAAGAKKEIEKLRALPLEEQPHELVFVVSKTVSADLRAAIRAAWGDEESCQFWVGNELDERVKRHPEILREFFQVPPDWGKVGRIHNLPYASLGPLFQGREEVLVHLHDRLAPLPVGRATAIAGKAVRGLGGVGKTRLAVEYAWCYAAEHSALLFVGAQSAADLRRNLAALSERNILDLPEKDATEEEIREAAVFAWLREHSGWLLILDNVDSEEAAAAVDILVGRLHGGQVLLTGRLARWSAEVEAIELDVLAEGAAVSFLLERTKRRRESKEDGARAVELARELGFLPLALEQAGAYISERRLTFAAYLEEWASRRDAVLAWFDPRVSHYPASVAVTWQTSFDRLQAPARQLLERLAWLGPEPIPETLLDVPVPGVEEDPGRQSADALVELETYLLVTRAPEALTFTVHRLVQNVTRCSQRADPVALAEALEWVNAAFLDDPQDVRTWPTLDPLAPHALTVARFADEGGLADQTAWLLNQLGALLWAKALHFEAEPLMRSALAIAEKSYGPDHPTVAILLSNLAAFLQTTNRLAEAESLMCRALAIAEKSYGPDHPDVAIDSNNLAQLFQDTNRLAEAEPLMRRALAIDEKSYVPDHPKVANRLNNLAMLLKATNCLAEAEPLMRRALAIDEKSYGPDHPNVARDLNNLARLLQATNRLAEAEPLMRRSLGIFLELGRRTGHEHPNLQEARANYVVLLEKMGRSTAEVEAAIESLTASPKP